MREQRIRRRFRITLPVVVSWAIDRQRRIASGLVVEIGSDAVVISSAEAPPSNTVATASIEWPVKLDDGCCLRLVVVGRIVSARHSLVELAIERHEYRTAARADAFFANPRRDDRPSVVPIHVAS